MDLTLEQQMTIALLLGKATVRFERHGTYFANKRTPEMDALVDAGALRREETVEAWGPCVTYVATDEVRNQMALLALRSNVANNRPA